MRELGALTKTRRPAVDFAHASAVNAIGFGNDCRAAIHMQEIEDMRCSIVCGMMPSSAATTSSANRCRIRLPACAYEALVAGTRRIRSVAVRQRQIRKTQVDRDAGAFSSGRRSVSTPVNVFTSNVCRDRYGPSRDDHRLRSGYRAGRRKRARRRDSAIHQKSTVFDAADDRARAKHETL